MSDTFYLASKLGNIYRFFYMHKDAHEAMHFGEVNDTVVNTSLIKEEYENDWVYITVTHVQSEIRESCKINMFKESSSAVNW